MVGRPTHFYKLENLATNILSVLLNRFEKYWYGYNFILTYYIFWFSFNFFSLYIYLFHFSSLSQKGGDSDPLFSNRHWFPRHSINTFYMYRIICYVLNVFTIIMTTNRKYLLVYSKYILCCTVLSNSKCRNNKML